MVAGATCIDDADVLRAGSTASVLGHRVMAPSTLGTFLRSFTFGNVRQLDSVAEHAARSRLGSRRWSGRLANDDRPGLDDSRGPRQLKAGRLLRLHPRAGLSPGAWRPAPRPVRCCTCAFERARPTPSAAPSASCARPSDGCAGPGPVGTAHAARRLGVLLQVRHRRVRRPRRALLDHGASDPGNQKGPRD